MIKTYIDGVLQATPIVLRHNQLIGLNDDVNFQHITATDRTKLNNLSGTNTGDETASTIINKIGDGSKINSNYLPSYVDDVLEFVNIASFPATGEVGKIYIALDVNLTYRWGGSGYVEISPSIALGETSATAYRGDRGASAYAHSILTSGTNPHNTTFTNIASKPTTLAGYGITDGAIQGTAYSNLENNVKVVQGVPAGGKMYLGAGAQTGAIKIKLPKNKTNTMYKFHVRMNGQLDNKNSASEYVVKGYNSLVGVGNAASNINTTHQVTVIKDNPSTMSPIFYFCTGATEDYILIGEITGTHNFKSVVIDDIEIHHSGISDDWSKDWVISLVTTLETLDSTKKVAVTPSLNATHLNGVQEDTSATANTIAKRDTSGFITPSQTLYNIYNTTAIYGKNYFAPASGGQKITMPLAIENKVIEIYKSNNSYNTLLGITGTDVIYDVSGNDITTQLTTVNGFTKFKYAKFVAMKTQLNTGNDGVVKWVLVEFKTINFVEDMINDVFTFLKKITVKSTDTNALDVQNATGTSVFAVDTQNQVVTGSAVDTAATANKIVKRDANGAITNTQYKLSALNTAPVSATATGTLGEVRVTAGGIYYCTATNTWRKALPVTVVTETITELTSTFTNSTLPNISYGNKYQWLISSGASSGIIESTHNIYSGSTIYSLVTGATVTTVTANSVYSMRIGNSVLEIKFDVGSGAISYRVTSGTVTEITVQRLQQGVTW